MLRSLYVRVFCYFVVFILHHFISISAHYQISKSNYDAIFSKAIFTNAGLVFTNARFYVSQFKSK